MLNEPSGSKHQALRQIATIICELLRAGEVEIDEPGQFIVDKQHIVGKKIGVDDAARQMARPVPVEKSRALCAISAARPGCTSVGAGARLRRTGRAKRRGPRHCGRCRAKSAPARCSLPSASPTAAQRRTLGLLRHMPSRKVTIAAGRPAIRPSAPPCLLLTGCGQVKPVT